MLQNSSVHPKRSVPKEKQLRELVGCHLFIYQCAKRGLDGRMAVLDGQVSVPSDPRSRSKYFEFLRAKLVLRRQLFLLWHVTSHSAHRLVKNVYIHIVTLSPYAWFALKSTTKLSLYRDFVGSWSCLSYTFIYTRKYICRYEINSDQMKFQEKLWF